MDQPQSPPPKKRYRPWPKKIEGARHVIDKDKLKKEYLAAGLYSWEDFCNLKGYDPSARKAQEFPLRAWRELWIQNQVEVDDNSVAQARVEAKGRISRRRLQWLDHSHDMVQQDVVIRSILVRKVFADHNFNEQNAAAIQAGTIRARPAPTASEALTIARLTQTIMQNGAMANLMPGVFGSQQAVIPIAEKSAEDRNDELEDDRIRNTRVNILGQTGVPPQKLVEVMAGYFDQIKPETPETASPDPQEGDPIEDEGEG